MGSNDHKHLTSGDMTTPKSQNASEEKTALLPAVQEPIVPAVRPISDPRTVKKHKHGRNTALSKRLLRIARGWGNQGVPAKPVQVTMTIPDLLGSLGLAMLQSQLPTSDIERQ